MLIQKYNPLWIQNFKNLKNEFQQALQGIFVEIDHVGSTSVVGLAAKPIIDIDIVYWEDEDFEKIKNRLSNIGYYHNGDQGIYEREVFKRKDNQEKHPILDKINHHLYVCPSDGNELQRHLLFRDFLRKNEWVRKEYEKIKFEIAEEVNHDRKKYAALKEKRAKQWIQSIVDLAKKENTKEM
ncbi:MAG: GrpB family protein [Saprospiraceae bacterium]